MSMDLDLDLDLELGGDPHAMTGRGGGGSGVGAGSNGAGHGSGLGSHVGMPGTADTAPPLESGGGGVELGVLDNTNSRHGAVTSTPLPVTSAAPPTGRVSDGGRAGSGLSGTAASGRSAWGGGSGVLGAAVGGSVYSYSSPQAGRRLYHSASSSSLDRAADTGAGDPAPGGYDDATGDGGPSAVSSRVGDGAVVGSGHLESSRLLGGHRSRGVGLSAVRTGVGVRGVGRERARGRSGVR